MGHALGELIETVLVRLPGVAFAVIGFNRYTLFMSLIVVGVGAALVWRR